MFLPFPGFEEFELRVEVEWQERTRTVVAKFKRWFSTERAVVVVCAFEDEPDDGEWLLVHSLAQAYFLTNPQNLLRLRCKVLSSTQREFFMALKRRTATRLTRAIANAFAGRGIQVVRAFELHELPHEPRLVFLLGAQALWYWQKTSFSPSFSAFDVSEKQARELLLREWNDENSDTRFSWQWPQWNDEERKVLCCGFEGDLRDMARVMRWILTGAHQLWEAGSGWTWTIHPEFASRGYVTNFSDSGRPLILTLSAWQEWLFAYFAPGWRADWMERHECVQGFWRRVGALESVRMDEPPTMHEQLEAKLDLREWLRENAPDEVERLL